MICFLCPFSEACTVAETILYAKRNAVIGGFFFIYFVCLFCFFVVFVLFTRDEYNVYFSQTCSGVRASLPFNIAEGQGSFGRLAVPAPPSFSPQAFLPFPLASSDMHAWTKSWANSRLSTLEVRWNLYTSYKIPVLFLEHKPFSCIFLLEHCL